MEILRTDTLCKQYFHKDGIVDAIKDISLIVEQKDFVTITGASGSGKTTLLLTLAGLIKPTSGKIVFKDSRIDNKGDKSLALFRKTHIGFVMQNFALVPYLSAIQNVMIPLSLKRISKKEQFSKADSVLEMVGLMTRKNHFPRELSAGQQQRVAIARALVNNPTMILADEPTGNLDPALSKEILDFLKKINEENGITILMVTHSPLATEYGNKKIKLSEGKII